MGVTTTQTNKPFNPRGNDQSPKGYNRAALYSGKALDFDGVNDNVAAPNLSILSTSDFAICYAAKFEQSGDNWAVSQGTTGTNNAIITGRQAGDVIRFAFFGNDLDAPANDTPPLNEWCWLAFTYNRTTKERKIYINGVLSTEDISAANPNPIGSDFQVSSYSGVGGYYNNQVSNVKVFNTALTAAQVADLYNNPEKVVPTGVDNTALKLWLPMQEGAGTTAINGAPDALGSEQITGFTNGSTYAFDTFTTSGNDISSAIKTSGFAGAASNAISLTNGDKVFVSFDYTHTSGDPLRVLISQNASGAGAAMSDVVYISATGKFTHIFTVTSTQNGYLQLGTGGSTQSINASMENISFKILSNIGAINGATWTHGIGAPVSQTSVIDWNKWTLDGSNEVLVPQGLTAGRDLLGNLFENVRKQGALNLDGNSWAEVHDNASLDVTTGLTLETWIYVEDNATQGRILSKWGNTQPNRSFQMFMNNAVVRFLIGDGSSQNGLNSATSLTEGNWHHIVGTYDGANIKIYIDGSEDVTTAETFTIYNSNEPLYIGGYTSNANLSDNPLAQPRIYNRALTAEEVQRSYDSNKNTYTNS